MYCSEEDINKIRGKINIKEYVSNKVKLTKKEDIYTGICPFHNSLVSTFIIDENSQTYGCYECGCSGDIFDFVMNYFKKPFSEAVSMMALVTGVGIDKTIRDEGFYLQQKKIVKINDFAKKYYQKSLKKSDKPLNYIKSRKIQEEMLVKFGIGFADPNAHIYDELKKQGFVESDIMASGLVAENDKYNKLLPENRRYDKFYNRVIFPIVNENDVVIGFGGRVTDDKKPKYINSVETIVYDKSSNLFGLNFAKNSNFDYFLLCEGYMDVISMHQAGFDNAVASLGTALTLNQVIKMSKYKKKVVLTYDSDEAGMKATKRAIPMLESKGIKVKIIDMNPYKDPDEFIKSLGPDKFKERILKADDSYPWIIKNLLKADKLPYEQKIEDIASIVADQTHFSKI